MSWSQPSSRMLPPSARSARAPNRGRRRSPRAARRIRWPAWRPQTTNRATCALTSDPGRCAGARPARRCRAASGRSARRTAAASRAARAPGRRQVAAPDLVVVLRAAGVHHQRAVAGQRILERQVNLVGAAGNRADRAHRGVHHHHLARRDAKAAESFCQLVSRMHRLRLFAPFLRHPKSAASKSRR